MENRASRWLERNIVRWKALGVICAVVLAVFAWNYIGLQGQISEAEAERRQLEAQLAQLRLQQSDLKVKIERVGSPSSVESAARGYGYVKEGELCFEILNPEALDNYTEEECQIIMDETLY